MSLALTFVSLERRPALIGLASDHFHIILPIQTKTFSPQEFTQTFDLMNFCAQRAKFWLVDFR